MSIGEEKERNGMISKNKLRGEEITRMGKANKWRERKTKEEGKYKAR